MHIGSGLNTVSSMYRQQKGNNMKAPASAEKTFYTAETPKVYQIFTTDNMLWTGGNGTGLSYCLKYADDSTDENPVVLAKGVDENGKEFEQRIYINDVNPSNATVVEMRALEAHYKVEKQGGFTSLPDARAGQAIGDADEQVGKMHERNHERQVVHDGVTVDDRLVDVKQARNDSHLGNGLGSLVLREQEGIEQEHEGAARAADKGEAVDDLHVHVVIGLDGAAGGKSISVSKMLLYCRINSSYFGSSRMASKSSSISR